MGMQNLLSQAALALSLGFSIVLCSTQANADAVPAPPSSCPKDTHPVTRHTGTGCAPDSCPVGSEGHVCAGGRPCCLIPLCGEPRDPPCATGHACTEVRICAKPGKTMSAAGAGRSYREATGYCGETTGCPPGSTCEIVPTCIMSSYGGISAPSRRRAACSCSMLDHTSDGAPLAISALCVTAILVRRRNRH